MKKALALIGIGMFAFDLLYPILHIHSYIVQSPGLRYGLRATPLISILLILNYIYSTRKALMLIGKGIIVLSLLYPCPMLFLNEFPGWIYELTGWGWIYTLSYFNCLLPIRVSYDVFDVFADNMNLWPQLVNLTIGILLCVISKYKSKNYDEQKDALSSGNFLLQDVLRFAILWGGIIIGGYIGLAWGIVGIYYYFRYCEITLPITALALFLCYSIWYGIKFYRESNKK